jgi:hypothetical protein
LIFFIVHRVVVRMKRERQTEEVVVDIMYLCYCYDSKCLKGKLPKHKRCKHTSTNLCVHPTCEQDQCIASQCPCKPWYEKRELVSKHSCPGCGERFCRQCIRDGNYASCDKEGCFLEDKKEYVCVECANGSTDNDTMKYIMQRCDGCKKQLCFGHWKDSIKCKKCNSVLCADCAKTTKLCRKCEKRRK